MLPRTASRSEGGERPKAETALRLSPLAIAILIGSLFLAAGSCVFSPGRVPEGKLVDWTGCKAFQENGPQGEGASRECLEYDYDGESILLLKHVNAGFNCCPEKITADISLFPGEIRIEEKEASSLCDCFCLYDLNYEFVHIKPGNYRIAVSGPYLREEDPPLDFDIDLKGPRSGGFCLERTHYPWFN